MIIFLSSVQERSARRARAPDRLAKSGGASVKTGGTTRSAQMTGGNAEDWGMVWYAPGAAPQAGFHSMFVWNSGGALRDAPAGMGCRKTRYPARLQQGKGFSPVSNPLRAAFSDIAKSDPCSHERCNALAPIENIREETCARRLGTRA